jgi:formylglycine-generating enzyme
LRYIVTLTLLTLFFVSACTLGPSNHRKHSKKYFLKVKKNNKQLSTHINKFKRKIKNSKRTTKKLPPVARPKIGLLPTVIHPVNGTLMVLVDPSTEPTTILKKKQGYSTLHTHTSSGSKKVDIFYIDHTEVTLNQYKKTHPAHDQAYITGKVCSLCPALSVDWVSAEKHCRAVGKRLPTEAEWEFAAGSPLKKNAAWNSNTKRPFANLVGESDGFLSVAPVGSFPLGAGPYGALDMIGNVWEWVDTPIITLQKKLGSKKSIKFRISKGGGWTSPLNFATPGYRNVVDGNIKNPTFGFRCAKSIS